MDRKKQFKERYQPYDVGPTGIAKLAGKKIQSIKLIRERLQASGWDLAHACITCTDGQKSLITVLLGAETEVWMNMMPTYLIEQAPDFFGPLKISQWKWVVAKREWFEREAEIKKCISPLLNPVPDDEWQTYFAVEDPQGTDCPEEGE